MIHEASAADALIPDSRFRMSPCFTDLDRSVLVSNEGFLEGVWLCTIWNLESVFQTIRIASRRTMR